MQYGYEGASIRCITKACGIREASFYNHYKSKEHLLNCIYDAMDDFLEKANPGPKQLAYLIQINSPVQFFEAFFLSYCEHNELTNKIAIFIMKEDFRNDRAKEYVLERNCRSMAILIKEVLEKYQKAGKLKTTCDCEFIAYELNYYYLGLLTEWTHVKYCKEDDSYLKKRLIQHIHYIFQDIVLEEDQVIYIQAENLYNTEARATELCNNAYVTI